MLTLFINELFYCVMFHTDHWIPNESQASYKFYGEIISEVEHHGLALKKEIPQILQRLAPSYELKNVSNFVMKVRNKKASKIDEILPLISSAEIIGPFCKAEGITRQWLNGQSNDLKSNLRVTNAIILLLFVYCLLFGCHGN